MIRDIAPVCNYVFDPSDATWTALVTFAEPFEIQPSGSCQNEPKGCLEEQKWKPKTAKRDPNGNNKQPNVSQRQPNRNQGQPSDAKNGAKRESMSDEMHQRIHLKLYARVDGYNQDVFWGPKK